MKKPSVQDKRFAEKALSLAHTAALAMEEGQQYIDGIEHKALKCETQALFDERIEG